MNRNVHLPLTETVFYILLALRTPAHGYLVMQRVRELSAGEIDMAAGTLYGAVKNLLRLKWIWPQQGTGRRKVYHITETGLRMLAEECARMERALAAEKTAPAAF